MTNNEDLTPEDEQEMAEVRAEAARDAEIEKEALESLHVYSEDERFWKEHLEMAQKHVDDILPEAIHRLEKELRFNRAIIEMINLKLAKIKDETNKEKV